MRKNLLSFIKFTLCPKKNYKSRVFPTDADRILKPFKRVLFFGLLIFYHDRLTYTFIRAINAHTQAHI